MIEDVVDREVASLAIQDVIKTGLARSIRVASRAGKNVSELPNRPPLLYAADIAKIAETCGLECDIEDASLTEIHSMLEIIEMAVLLVRPDPTKTLATAVGFDKSGEPTIVLYNR